MSEIIVLSMTKKEKDTLVKFKNNGFSFTQFMDAVSGEFKLNMYYSEVENVFRKMKYRNNYFIREEDIMISWLYPEKIRVLEEK